MTYCVAMRLNKGLVFMSDTRTNAGVDNFAATKKMFTWSVPGERCITIMTAGNLATTQAMISLLNERSEAAVDRDPGILHQKSMFQVARLVGATLKEVIAYSNPAGPNSSDAFNASVIVGGQVKGGTTTAFMIYPEGNFIELTDESPFLQIGEAKYGKPILVRAYDPEMSFEDCLKLLMVSFDSTIKSNLSVGLPLDLHCYHAGSLKMGPTARITQEDPVYQEISRNWGDALKAAMDELPGYRLG
jgi:putative proteasome-type protease